MSDDETVYVGKTTSRQEGVFHTDKDCRQIKTFPRPKKRGPLEDWGYEECKVCAGEVGTGGYTEETKKPLRYMVMSGEVDL